MGEPFTFSAFKTSSAPNKTHRIQVVRRNQSNNTNSKDASLSSSAPAPETSSSKNNAHSRKQRIQNLLDSMDYKVWASLQREEESSSKRSRPVKRQRRQAQLDLSEEEMISQQHPDMDTFYVRYDGYETKPECEQKLYDQQGWWKGAQFCPMCQTTCMAMRFDEQLMWRVLNSKRHIIISGQAGSGKSHLLERFMTGCEGANFTCALTAPTGVAAANVGGETLHRRLGLGLAKDDPVTLFKQISTKKMKFNRTWKFLKNTDILVIDEISMVHPEFFTKLDYLFRKARGNSAPFGGVLLIMVGDFTQLGPVISKKKDEDYNGPYSIRETEVWSRMSITRIFLDRSYRQAEGDPFLDLLNEIRVGKMSDRGLDMLRSRIDADVSVTQTVSEAIDIHASTDAGIETADTHEEKTSSDEGEGDTESDEDEDDEGNATLKTVQVPGSTVTELSSTRKKKVYKLTPLDMFSYKWQVEKCNRQHLDILVDRDGEPLRKFYPALRVQKREHSHTLDPKEYEQARHLISKEGRARLKDNFPLFDIKLAVGAQVMMRCNKYMDSGIFNGSMGIVTGIENNFISVLFVVNGKFMSKPIDVDRAEFSSRVGKTAEIVMNQFPLTLAYASTIHKCQGLTLDSVRVDASRCFEAGQLYVALSRVRKLEHLSLIDFDVRSLLSNDSAVYFETANKRYHKSRRVDTGDGEQQVMSSSSFSSSAKA